VLTGLNLRIAVASIPPIVDELRSDLGLSATAAGLLTAAPVLCFGVLAPVAPMLARRFGAERALLLALVPLFVGVLGRAAGSTFALFAGTLLAGAGVASANVLVPSVVKGRFVQRVGGITAVYVATLTGGAALAAGLTVPLERALGWEAALALWAVPAAIAVVVLALAVLPDRAAATGRGGGGGARQLLGNPLAWQVTLYMGLQSFVFYAALAWLPSILRDDGFSAETAGTLLALYALGGIPGALVVPVLATRMRDQRLLATGVTVLEAVALLGLLVAPDAALAWVVLFALGQGGAISLALTLMVLRAPDPRRAAELSGMAQAIGYSIAALGPLAVGALHDWSGDWSLPLAALLVTTAPLLAAGVGAGRARVVEISAPSRCLCSANTRRMP
jgi:CP family cyanate transporter-like MFS transporter